MSAVSSVLAVGVLQGQPVNSVPRVPLDCIAGCLCSVPFYYPVHLQWTVCHRVLFSLLLPPHGCCDEGPFWGNFGSALRWKGSRLLVTESLPAREGSLPHT